MLIELEGTKREIYEYITKNPGAHLRKIKRDLGIGMGNLQYHLYALEKLGMVKTRRQGLYKFVFPAGIFGEKQTIVLGALSLETEREILLRLAEKGALTQGELVKLVGVSSATMTWHMKRLVENEIVERKRIGKEVSYNILGERDEILKFIENYQPVFWQKWSSRLADTVISLGGNEDG